MEISDVLEQLETNVLSPAIGNELADAYDIHNHILDLKDMLLREKMDYHVSKLILYHSYIRSLWCVVLEREVLYVYMLILTFDVYTCI